MRIWDIFKRFAGASSQKDDQQPSQSLFKKRETPEPTTKGTYITQYEHGKTLDEIRSNFAEEAHRVIAENHTMTPISHITAVGALQNPFGMIEPKDTSYIQQSIATMLEAGIPVSPDVEIDVVNFKDGRDFLAEDTPTDALLICRLYNAFPIKAHDYWNGLDGLKQKAHTPEAFGEALQKRVLDPLQETNPDALEQREFSDPRDQYVAFMQSPQLTDNPNIWADRVYQSEAKVIFASFEIMNIGEGFGHPDLTTLHSFDDSYSAAGYDENGEHLWDDKNEWFNRFSIFTPDLIVRDDFLEELQDNDLPHQDSLIHSAMEFHNRPDFD